MLQIFDLWSQKTINSMWSSTLLQNLCDKGHQSAAYRSISLGNRKKLKFVCSLELLLHPGTEHQFPPFKTFILHYYTTTLSFRQNTATAQREVSMSWCMKITIYCPTSWLTQHSHWKSAEWNFTSATSGLFVTNMWWRLVGQLHMLTTLCPTFTEKEANQKIYNK